MTFFKTPSLISVLLLLFFFLCAAVSSFRLEMSSSDIATLCDRIIDRDFCLRLLNSTAAIRGANVVRAGEIVLTVGDQKARETEKFVTRLLASGKATDPEVKRSYKACLEKYGDAVKSISVAKDALATGDYDKAFTAATAAQRDANNCDRVVKVSPTSRVRESNKYLVSLLEVVLGIVVMVGG